MPSISRGLFGFGAACALLALITLVWLGPLSAAGESFGTWLRLCRVFLDQPLWQAVMSAAGGCAVVAVMATAGHGIVERWAPARRVGPGQYDGLKISQVTSEVRAKVEALLSGRGPSVVLAFDEIVRGAVASQASDIHLSPTAEGLRVTYRVSGSLYEAVCLEPRWAQPMATRIKVMAGLETHIRRKPQDGRLVTHVGGVRVEARVSTLPTESGERVVLRLISGSRGIPSLDALGLSERVLARLQTVLSKPQGILFVTGPVGSGKTTTLYASLKHLADTRGKTTSIVTLEDPIEMELPFATQTQMHDRSGRTFASTLRSVLRQDPNVLMVGEIRDRETAEIATQAGLTGHLIVTTLHSDSAAGPFARLIDMKVEPFAVASSTLACLSQRLVRTLCSACRRAKTPPEPLAKRLLSLGIDASQGEFFAPEGCEYCEGEGYTGRAPLTELLVVTPEIRQAVIACRSTEEIAELARKSGMQDLTAQGLRLAQRGDTSLEELVRVIG